MGYWIFHRRLANSVFDITGVNVQNKVQKANIGLLYKTLFYFG